MTTTSNYWIFIVRATGKELYCLFSSDSTA